MRVRAKRSTLSSYSDLDSHLAIILHHGQALIVSMNLQPEAYVEDPPDLQRTQVHRVSHFHSAGIKLTAFPSKIGKR